MEAIRNRLYLVLLLPLMVLIPTESMAQLDLPLQDDVSQQLQTTMRASHDAKLLIPGAKRSNRSPSPSSLNLSSNYSAKLNSLANVAMVAKRNGEEFQVVIKLRDTSTESIRELEGLGVIAELIYHPLAKVQAWLTAQQISTVSQLENVISVQAADQAHSRSGAVNSQGDTILKANKLRSMGFLGQGVRIGIISDGANDWQLARASGDLPNSISVYGSCSKRSENISACLSRRTCNEGTAMAEIVHDLAPGAEIAVAAVSTSLEFIQRLDQLTNDFKADIIVDDLGFFGEPYFENGDIAQAVAALPARVLYVSAAGNAAHIHYEADYSNLSIDGFNVHDFGNSDDAHGFIVPANGYVVSLLQWNDPFENPDSDYDLYISNQQAVIGSSTANQISGAVAFEAVCTPNQTANNFVGFATVDRVAGDEDRLEMFFLGSSAIEHPVGAGSVFGHPGVARSLAVGAINASDPSNDSIAFYSSRGPSRIDFPNSFSQPKPDLVGIDGVSVTGAGGFPSQFFGTSAAAPHVAAVAAQLFSVSDKVTALNVKRALINGSIDLGSAGRDSVYGAGRVDASKAKLVLRQGPAVLPYGLMLDD